MSKTKQPLEYGVPSVLCDRVLREESRVDDRDSEVAKMSKTKQPLEQGVPSVF